MTELARRPNVAWAAGESYRRLQQPQAAIPHYENALAGTNHKPDQFKAAFWLEQSVMGAMGLANVKGQKRGNSPLPGKLRVADQKTWDAWQTLNPEEKQVAFSEVQNELEQNVKSSILVRSSPRILLEMLGQNLATATAVPDNAVNGSANSSQPTVKMIHLLADLSKRFAQLGLDAEKKKSRQLQRNVNTKLVKDDRDTMKIWTDELTTLADEYRQANDYLEAGRLFTLTGTNNNQWEGRAEALYKGGLLLYRSGRRDEALAAFKEAANDGNNILYADLAKKRLEQLQQ
jgi:tetratricopeptide (TPR) repeat protein